ncbi:MAG: hypothetical protein JSS49_10085 [Planctomycetes bacterium]|nr:hypothetical protein [Planctomycetota bacterium]
MKYMLLIYSRESAWTEEESMACREASSAVCHELAAKGQFRSASPLHPVATARTVRVRNGKRLITDGPFAETTEQLGGYFIIDVPDLDAAIAVASRLPPAAKGTVEIRPLFHLEGLPPERLAQRDSVAAAAETQYMFLCYDDEEAWNRAGPEALRAAMQEAVELTLELDRQGKFLSASPLHPVATATSVQVRNGKKHLIDGPFAETREVLGGYYLILARDDQEAIGIAARHSGARVGAVEVRRVVEMPGLASLGQATE